MKLALSLLLIINEHQVYSTECQLTGNIPVGGYELLTFHAQPGDIYFNTCGSDFDTVLELYYPDDLVNRIDYNDDMPGFACNFASHLPVLADPNYSGTYILSIHGWNFWTGGNYIISFPCLVNPSITTADHMCNLDGLIKYPNWDLMVNQGQDIPDYNFTMSFDESDLSLTFDIDLEYMGGEGISSIGNKDGLGSTYVIDFYSFGANGDLINEPGNCQNRLAASFDGIADFRDYWTYSVAPNLDGELGTTATMSYPPPSQYWGLTADECTPINYFGEFSWSDLIQCQDYDGNDLIEVTDDGTSITLTGTLYVTLVAPYQMDVTDTGFYRTLPFVQQDFSITILKQINVLSSIGIDLFIASIIGMSEDETDGSFELSILTQSADFIELINGNVLSTPFGAGATVQSATTSCLTASSFTCAQIFTITIPAASITCPPADFSGVYELGFQVSCRDASADGDVCGTFIDDNGSPNIVLEVESNFIDTTCVPALYQVIFNGNMVFYDDAQFFAVHNPSNEYVIGQDIIYIQVSANFPDDNDGSNENFDIFAVEINNVFVCTADDEVDLTQDLDQQGGQGGCLSSNIDADGRYNIITNGNPNPEYFAEIIELPSLASNTVQFSFLTFDTGRTTIYVHMQLTLILQDGTRRRLQVVNGNIGNDGNEDNSVITDTDGSSQIRHFIDSTGIIDGDKITISTLSAIDSAEKLNIMAVVGVIGIVLSMFY